MSSLTITVMIAFAILTVWGLVAPRGQWRALAGWSRHDSDGGEPGPLGVAILRIVSAVGLVVVLFGSISLANPVREELPRAVDVPARMSTVERLWGSPAPVVVNRVFVPVSAPPSGVVAQPVLRYQAMIGAQRTPSYLFGLKNYTRHGAKPGDGYIGSSPQVGLTALDSADLVLQVRADKRCIPYSVALVETEDTVTVGVYFGQPNAAGSGNDANVTQCDTGASGSKSVSMLIPVDLKSAVAGRTVRDFDGSAIESAGVPTE
ncbi:hypothetical protein [Lacisediminihabitans profunda]|uniref:DUF6199 domain-containing protein n=1 Tax=Lacisediminihabitans profunda TaxID=2594790 RepID=A0A5C8UTD2_9MICO|nr:hypothetical protein [Lacisediminihabitans profunda]TXN31160.1 hypothetical protein FVP33_06120 [Lacisediminihabitans profunda]